MLSSRREASLFSSIAKYDGLGRASKSGSTTHPYGALPNMARVCVTLRKLQRDLKHRENSVNICTFFNIYNGLVAVTCNVEDFNISISIAVSRRVIANAMRLCVHVGWLMEWLSNETARGCKRKAGFQVSPHGHPSNCTIVAFSTVSLSPDTRKAMEIACKLCRNLLNSVPLTPDVPWTWYFSEELANKNKEVVHHALLNQRYPNNKIN